MLPPPPPPPRSLRLPLVVAMSPLSPSMLHLLNVANPHRSIPACQSCHCGGRAGGKLISPDDGAGLRALLSHLSRGDHGLTLAVPSSPRQGATALATPAPLHPQNATCTHCLGTLCTCGRTRNAAGRVKKSVCGRVCVRAKAGTGSRTSCLELCHHVQFLLVSHSVKRDNTVILKHLKIWG